MRYIRINARPNRKMRRSVNAVARRAPTPENLKEAEAMRKLGVNQPFERTDPRTGRNEPCTCKSGRKFKVCHGRAA